MLVEGLQTALANDAGLQSFIGTPSTRSDKTTGIFPLVAPEQVPMPYVVMQQVSGSPVSSMEGTNRLTLTRWRFSCYGTTYKQAKQLARALKMAMISLNGPLPSGNAVIMGSWAVMETDDLEVVPHATIYTVHSDFNINYIDNE